MQVSGNIGLTPIVNYFEFGRNTQNPTAGFNLNQNQIKYVLQNSDSFFLYQISTSIK
jgi:hypothetical protein